MPLPVIAPAATGVSDAAAAFVLQVDTASSQSTPTWVTAFGLSNFVPAKSDNMVEITDFDSVGWQSFQPFLSGWTNTCTFERKKYAAAYDVGQEFIRAKNLAKEMVHVRWFDRNGGEAYEGWGFATWEEQGGSANDKRAINVTITGNGARTTISNPVAVNSVAVVGSATPSGVATGGVVRINGSNFTGATDVKFGATSATVKDITSDTIIVAVMPSGSAGAANITVINGVGTSNALPYTRG